MTVPAQDSLALDAARFLVASLSLADDPETLAAGLDRIDRDDQTAVYALQMNSTVGPAAFLVYAYQSDGPGERSAETEKRHAGDVQTLELAQARGVPGPRLVASGELNGNLFVLATDPQTFAALAGEDATPSEPPPPPAEAARIRREAAERLLKRLKGAEAEAERWLQAIGPLEQVPARIDFDDVETELALYLLGPTGIRNILRLANVVLEKGQSAVPADPAPEPTDPTGGTRPTPIRRNAGRPRRDR